MSKGFELLTPAEMAAADRYAIETGTSGFALMQRAGEAVARLVASLAGVDGARRRIVVLCGPGNNGGDGFVAAKRLSEMGLTVEVALLGSPQALRGDAASACREWHGPVVDPFGLALDSALIIVDALF
ncbi:MAG: NAD(P)H-hydrate epimerase, partial [Hyphomicrobiales bacterium]